MLSDGTQRANKLFNLCFLLVLLIRPAQFFRLGADAAQTASKDNVCLFRSGVIRLTSSPTFVAHALSAVLLQLLSVCPGDVPVRVAMAPAANVDGAWRPLLRNAAARGARRACTGGHWRYFCAAACLAMVCCSWQATPVSILTSFLRSSSSSTLISVPATRVFKLEASFFTVSILAAKLLISASFANVENVAMLVTSPVAMALFVGIGIDDGAAGGGGIFAVNVGPSR